MNESSKKPINLRIILINVCPFLIITAFFFFGFVQDILIIPVIIWLTSVNIRTFEKFHLFIITQAIMLGTIAVTNSASALLYHFIISDDYESLWIIQVFTQIEVSFLIFVTLIVSVVKALLKRKRSKIIPKFVIDYPLFSISPKTVEFITALKASPIEHEFVTNKYITFAGKAFGSDIPLMFGIHFNASKIEFIEVFHPTEYYQSADYDINKSFSQLSEILRRQYGEPLTNTDTSTGNTNEKWQTDVYTVEHYIIDRFGLEEHLHIKFTKYNPFHKE